MGCFTALFQCNFHFTQKTAGLIKKGPRALGVCGGRGQHSLLPIGQREGEVFLPRDSQAQSDIYCIYHRDQTHTQMSRFSNSISRSDKQSLERGHCRQKVQDGGPFPPRLLPCTHKTHPEPPVLFWGPLSHTWSV
uniref:Uncharacterized protein n=1 Tax=Coturnix japonica TaxID=93934 RepID=A0A8C2T7C3_COTJA